MKRVGRTMSGSAERIFEACGRSISRVLLLIVGVIACSKSSGTTSASDAAPSVPPSTLARQREVLASAYRVKPDARFVEAFGVVSAIVAGGTPAQPEVTFASGHWTIKVGNETVGDLPELASFSDASAVLAKWAASGVVAHPIAAAPPRPTSDLTTPAEAFDTLKRVQAEWQAPGHTTAMLEDAANALLTIVMQMRDDLEIADTFAARALALLAILKGPARAETARLEALLADALGYPRAAREAGSTLPAGDPVRAYATRDDAQLATIANGAHDRLTRVLRLRRLAQTHDRSGEAAWRARAFGAEAFTLPVLGARLEEPEIMTERAFAFAMPTLVALAAAERAGDARARTTEADLAKWTDADAFVRATKKVQGDLALTDATLLEQFEGSIGRMGAGASGAIFDAQLEKTYFRAGMGTALYRAGIHALDRWNTPGAAKTLLASYAKGGGGLGDDWRAWYGALVKAQEPGERVGGALWSSVGVLPNLGAPATLRVVEELEKSADWGDPRILGAARQVFARVDSRPRHRGALMTVANSGLLDLNMVERLARSLADLEPSSALAFALDFLGDTAALEKLLHDPDVEPHVAAWIVPRFGLDEEAARAELKKLVAASPDAWPVRSAFADYLEARGAFADERALATDWLARNGKNEGLTPLVAKTLIARTYYLEKDYAAGWRIIEPLLPSQYGGAMMRGAYLLSALGKKDRAEELAKARLDRYKDLESLALLLELYWHDGRLADAGALVAHPPVDASLFQWRVVVGKAFAGEFASRPPFDGVAAFGAMKDADPHVLREIATAVNLAGNHDLAFNLEQPLGVPGMENLEFLLRTAAFLEQGKGHSAALTWLKPRVPPQMLEPLSKFAFGAKMDPLLWELVPTPAADRKDEAVGWIWLFRTAASVRTPNDPHAAEITRYYEGAGDSRADVIGRYLLGKADEKAVIALATDDKSACEVAFWLGYKAQIDKRYADASDWYRTAVESALTKVYEYRQSYDQLQAWYSKGKALSRL